MRIKAAMISKRSRRTLISIVTAYAVAAQSLLIALGGFSFVAVAGEITPLFELCVHTKQDVPEQPTKVPDDAPCTHCMVCFTGSAHALIRSTDIPSSRIDAEVTIFRRVGDQSPSSGQYPHSIANPRGPPLSA
jgi:hypothetical protein